MMEESFLLNILINKFLVILIQPIAILYYSNISKLIYDIMHTLLHCSCILCSTMYKDLGYPKFCIDY